MAKTDRLMRERLRQFEARQTLHSVKKARLKRDQWFWIAAAALAVLVSSLAVFAYSSIGPGAPKSAPDASLSEYRQWTGEITISDVELGISLDGENAPQAVASFVSLAAEGFYDDLDCHRLTTEIIFVLQCGDPLGNGAGGPGYTFGPIENAPTDDLYSAGTLAMARNGDNSESMGSQFFIVYEDSTIPSDAVGGYTILGQITTPLDEFMTNFVEPGTVGGSNDGKPSALATLQSITIR